jgi:hypothetical protein
MALATKGGPIFLSRFKGIRGFAENPEGSRGWVRGSE